MQENENDPESRAFGSINISNDITTEDWIFDSESSDTGLSFRSYKDSVEIVDGKNAVAVAKRNGDLKLILETRWVKRLNLIVTSKSCLEEEKEKNSGDDGVSNEVSASKDHVDVEIIMRELEKEFKIHIVENYCYLGMEFKVNKNSSIFINQWSFIKRIIGEFNMESCDTVFI